MMFKERCCDDKNRAMLETVRLVKFFVGKREEESDYFT